MDFSKVGFKLSWMTCFFCCLPKKSTRDLGAVLRTEISQGGPSYILGMPVFSVKSESNFRWPKIAHSIDLWMKIMDRHPIMFFVKRSYELNHYLFCLCDL